tara:strand:+ start:5012 stop:6121 length:1110 start_codon:yes stop_codon:yes gene_type:complete
MVKIMIKQICKKSQSIKYKFPYETFGHAGFNKIQNKNNFIYQCKNSFFIYRKDKGLKKKLNKLFFSNKYTSSRFSSHVTQNKIGKKNTSHYVSMAEIIKKYIKKEPKKVLEVGCYDGKLLNELSRKFKRSKLYGYDVSTSIKKLFKKNCNSNFIENLDTLEEKFDLIICVNTFQYVPNFDDLTINMKRLLSKKGKIFFLNTFLDKYPFTINYGDQYNYITRNGFMNFLRFHNLNGKIITNSVEFPRNLIGVFTHSNKKYKFLKSKKVSYYLKYLKNVEKKLFKISSNEVNIFGSTISAKFLFEILKKKVKKITFVDENPHKINKKFFGKKIIHPSQLKNDSLVLMSYGLTNNQIINKLNKKYNFRYIKF